MDGIISASLCYIYKILFYCLWIPHTSNCIQEINTNISTYDSGELFGL